MVNYITINKVVSGAVIKSDTFKLEQDAIDRVAELVEMPGYETAFYAEHPSVDVKYIIADTALKTITVNTSQVTADKLSGALDSAKTSIKPAMHARLTQGFTWKYNGGSTAYTVSIDASMEGFLTRLNAKLAQGREGPHEGFIRSNGVSFAIDDAGAQELCLFAGCWGDKIAMIRMLEDERCSTMTLAQLQAYDASAINWTIRDETIGNVTITDWTTADKNNGWDNSTVKQTP